VRTVNLSGKTVAVLVEDLYEDLELWYPVLRLREAGAQVTLVGPEAGAVYKSKHGYPARAELGMTDASADRFDAVVIPGGYAPDRLRRHRPMVEFVRAMHDRGKPVAFICHAGWVPISAGIVRGRRVTGFFSIRDDLVNAGAVWVDQEVVVDGALISSRGPADLPAFCRALIESLSRAPVA
jgi:protease I